MTMAIRTERRAHGSAFFEIPDGRRSATGGLGLARQPDVEGGQVDLLLARPLARHWLVTRSLLLVILCPVLLVLLMMVASRLALIAFAPEDAAWPSLNSIGLMAAHLVAVAWCFGALGLVLAAMVTRRISVIGPAAIVAVSLYLLDLLGAAWQPIRSAAVISPFHYYQGASVLAGTADSARDFLCLDRCRSPRWPAAYWRFTARDV